MLKIKDLSKTFGDIVALDSISFDVDDGEFIFVTGPSGAGKTTLIRLILHELMPDTGEIVLDDIDIVQMPRKDVPFLRQQVGVVFQDFKLLPERTVRENVEVALAVIGVDQNEWIERVNQVLELVDLGKRSELFPSQLSGGELQRVSLARALVVNPKVLLADEPTGNLDWDTADEIMSLFERINKEGKTVIVATHHRVIVDKLKKREVKLKMQGRVVKTDDKKPVKKKKKTKKTEEKKEPENKGEGKNE
jgi:cell division transport system ATP-binding protein